MIDTHTHLYDADYGDEAEQAVQRAIDAGVEMMILPGVDVTTIEAMKRLAGAFPHHLRMTMGLHPEEVNHSWPEAVKVIEAELRGGQYAAVGEVGMDLYFDRSHIQQQMQAFDCQVSLAEALGLPVVVHTREALDETLEVLKAHPGAYGEIHSWTGTPQEVEKVRAALGDQWYFGINGIVTFKNSRVREALAAIGLSRLLLETDAPYLAPVPQRGRRNESAYLPYILQYIADYMGLKPEEVEAATTANAHTLFRL